MLNPTRLLEERTPETRHVAGRENAWHGAPAVLIDDDALLDMKPRRLGKLGAWLGTDADDDRLRQLWQRLNSQMHPNPVPSVNVSEIRSELRAQNAEERLRERFINPDGTAPLSCRCGYLAPDETRSDDVDSSAINDRGQQRVRVG